MRTTLDKRRVQVVLEGVFQIVSMIEVLLKSDMVDSVEDGALLRALLLRMSAINSVAMRVFDDTDDDINEMESIVFGEPQGIEEVEA